MPEFNPFVKNTGGLGNIKDAPAQKNQPSQKPPLFSNLKIKPSVLVVVIVGLGLCGYLFFNMTQTKQNPQKNTGEKTDERIVLMKNQSVLFLNHYLNLNYTVFKEERSRAEAFMTPNMLSEYKENFYSNELVQKVINSQFLTDFYYNEIIPTTYEDPEGVVFPAIKVIGMAKYNSEIKYMSFEMPFTIVLAFVKDEQGQYKKIEYVKFQ